MTTEDPNGQATPTAPTAFLEGIYLQKRKSTIGTGGTAKTTEYRNFWATGSIAGDSVIMVLLDDAFKPTPVMETFPRVDMTEPTWFFIAEGIKKYQYIRPLLDRILAAPPQEAHPKQEPAAASPAPWWGGAPPSGPPANPFELKKEPKKPAPAKKGGWWDK